MPIDPPRFRSVPAADPPSDRDPLARTLRCAGRTVRTLDQTRLPFERVEIVLADADDCRRAIASMQVRGAPLIGAVAAFGLALALREAAADADLAAAGERLASARPTASNLRWALERVRRRVAPLPPSARAEAAWAEACAVADDDAAANGAIGAHGATLLQAVADGRARAGAPLAAGAPLQVLTHCNAGRLATVAHGTALAPVYALHARGVPLHVWVDETRPRNQGAGLTAWELAEAGVPCTVVADNAGGLLMRQGRVDAVLVGCDRVARNGDVANKVGTYLKALAARDAGVPFWVACPVSTIDADCPDGDAIPIECRDPDEVSTVRGRAEDGRLRAVQVVPDGVAAHNPAFDVTPARLVDALLTEHGVFAADAGGVAAALRAAAAAPDRR